MPKLIGLDETQAYRFTHRKCGAIFEYYESEVKVKTGKDWDGGGYVQWLIHCPKCSEQVCVKEW